MKRILLVEDNEMNRGMLSRRLGRRGFDVALAVDGLQGLDAARSSPFDLILMDLSLPVVDGWEAIRRLKADPRTRTIPIIALTAHAMSGDRERAVEAGCDDYDIKPIEFPRLVSKVEALLRRRESAPKPERAPATGPDVRRPASHLRLDLLAPITRIGCRAGFLAGESESRTDRVERLRAIGILIAEARDAVDASLLSQGPDRPVDLSALTSGVVTPAHEIIRVCDSLEASSSRTADCAEFLVHLSEVRKDAAQMISIVWQATADPGRPPA